MGFSAKLQGGEWINYVRGLVENVSVGNISELTLDGGTVCQCWTLKKKKKEKLPEKNSNAGLVVNVLA